jgi:hypothetical protein
MARPTIEIELDEAFGRLTDCLQGIAQVECTYHVSSVS